MNDSEVKQFANLPLVLAVDEEGRLYNRSLRGLLARLKIDSSVVEAFSALRIAARTLGLQQERWAEQHGLSVGRMAVLFRLMHRDDQPLSELAVALDSTPRNITGLVDHLERDGLVERVHDPEDRRSVRARLTAVGRERIAGIWKESIEHQYALVGKLTKEDLAQLRHLCLLLVENARKELGR